MFFLRKCAISFVALGIILQTGSAQAAVFSLFSSDAKYSHAVATAGVGIGGKIALTGAGLKVGTAIVAGSLVLSLADPDPATFFTGGFQHMYDPNLFTVVDSGWLGDWGEDPSLEAPPVDDSTWPGLEVALQDPNPDLSATVNDSFGSIDVSFDWGVDGYFLSGEEPINIFGVLYRAQSSLVVDELVTVPVGETVLATAGQSLSVVGSSLTCRPPEETEILDCSGDQTTVYFFRSVPEPGISTLFISLLGVLAFWHQRKDKGVQNQGNRI